MDMCIYITESLCCTAEIIKTLWINCISIKLKKKKLPSCILKWLYLFALQLAMNESFYSYTMSGFSIVSVLNFSLSNRSVMLSCFNFHFPNEVWYWSSLNMLNCHLHIFLGEVSVYLLTVLKSVFFFFWGGSVVLSKFWLTVIHQICLLQMFPPILGCLLILLMVSSQSRSF